MAEQDYLNIKHGVYAIFVYYMPDKGWQSWEYIEKMSSMRPV
jgi:hypothetical protein